MDYYIRIVGKVKHNKDVLWYYDENGFRYSKEELAAVVSGNTSLENVRLNSIVRKKLMIENLNIGHLRINMRVRGGKLVSSSGTLEVLNLVNKTIYVVCEDSSSGYTLYQRLLEYMYPNIRFKFTTSKGNSNLGIAVNGVMKQLKEDLNMIVIADYKRESEAYRNNIEDIRISSSMFEWKSNIWLFRPTCVEEIILSNINLRFRPNTLTESVKDYLKSGKLYYDVIIKSRGIEKPIIDGYRMYNGEIVNNLEALLAVELSKVSYIRYTKKSLSTCFVNVCCPRYLGDRNLVCKLVNKCHSGCESFTNDMSLACGLQNIVNNIINKDKGCLNAWNAKSKDNLYRRL